MSLRSFVKINGLLFSSFTFTLTTCLSVKFRTHYTHTEQNIYFRLFALNYCWNCCRFLSAEIILNLNPCFCLAIPQLSYKIASTMTVTRVAESRTEFKLKSLPEDAISSVKFAPKSSQFLLVSSWDCSVRLYDVTSNLERHKYSHELPVMDICFRVSVRFTTLFSLRTVNLSQDHNNQISFY